MIGYLGLGSNVGEPRRNLAAGVTGLRNAGVDVLACSSVYKTEPVGEITDQPDFLNAALQVDTELTPEGLLDVCKRIELDLGRDPGAPRHSPRPLDIDLLLFGDIELETDRLRLPHREVTSRRFVLIPLLELDPGLTLPDGTSLVVALDDLGPGQDVELAGAPLAVADEPGG